MNDAFATKFTAFSQEKLRPAIDVVTARKRSGLLLALLLAAVFFVLAAVVMYLVMLPYQKFMSEYKINDWSTYWPLVLLAPLSLAMIVFTVTYILSLRNTVKDFRETLIARMAEFIDPGLVHERRQPFGEADFDASLLFADGEKAVAGQDRFRGRAGDATVEFCDAHVPGDKNGKTLAGIYMKATLDKNFQHPLFIFPVNMEVSRSGIEAKLTAAGAATPGGLVRIDDHTTNRQVLRPAESGEWGSGFLSSDVGRMLEDVRRVRGGELRLGCWNGVMHLAILSPSDRQNLPGVFEGFDFGNCREFCREAKAAMALMRETSTRNDLWKS